MTLHEAIHCAFRELICYELENAPDPVDLDVVEREYTRLLCSSGFGDRDAERLTDAVRILIRPQSEWPTPRELIEAMGQVADLRRLRTIRLVESRRPATLVGTRVVGRNCNN